MSNKSFDMVMCDFKVGEQYSYAVIEFHLFDEPLEEHYEDDDITWIITPGEEMELDDEVKCVFHLIEKSPYPQSEMWKCVENTF